MAPRRFARRGLAVVLLCLIATGATVLVRQTWFAPKVITAFFATTTAIYPGDEVRVSGVPVGRIEAIQPDGTQSRMVMKIDRNVAIPADAKAVIVALNLVSARYVQLTPAYRSDGPTMGDGAVIPIEHTAVPVEWDEVKAQLTRLATDLGPTSAVSTPSMARLIDSASNAMGGNGDKLRQTLAQLSGAGRILADGSGNIVDTIKNLQHFVTTLRDSNQQIVQFQDRLATLSSVLDGSKSDLDAALKDLSAAVGEVRMFVAKYRDRTSEQIQRLADVTQNLVDHRTDLEQLLHVAPNSFANAYNMYNPDTGEFTGATVLNGFSNPVQFVCSQIGAIENATAPETASSCSQYLGPALRLLNFNYLPIPTNPLLAKAPNPDNIIYAGPPTLRDMLLPAEAPQAPPPPAQPEPQPTEGNPPS